MVSLPLTQSTISNIYKVLSIVTLAISAVLSIFFIEESIGLRIGIGIMFNVQFHLVYLLLSRAPLEMYRQVEKQKPELKTLARKVFRIFSWAAVIFSVIGFMALLGMALQDPKVLVGAMMLIAVFLGGYSSVLKLREN
ncbi:MAG: hypothetical protein HYZ51_03335 [Candidatus Doudnabacteria bacterium]|nr:hypothetical protein [Candidatus Doudnabacteria bacterium]